MDYKSLIIRHLRQGGYIFMQISDS